jgi:hypothetical protein
MNYLKESEQIDNQSSEKELKETEDMVQHEYLMYVDRIEKLSDEIVSKLTEFHTLVNDLKIKSEVYNKCISEDQLMGTAVQVSCSIFSVEYAFELLKGAAINIPRYKYLPQRSFDLKRYVGSSLSKLFSYIR